MTGYGNLGEAATQQTSLSFDAATAQKVGWFGFRLERTHFIENQYKGMGSNQLFQLHALYMYEKNLPNQTTSFSLKAGAPFMSLGQYQITNFYDDSEVSAPYLPPSMRSGWSVSGEKTISSYGLWLDVGMQQKITALSSESTTHKIGCHLNHFFYRFEVISGNLEAKHPNGSYIMSDSKQLARQHSWKGKGFALSYLVSW